MHALELNCPPETLVPALTPGRRVGSPRTPLVSLGGMCARGCLLPYLCFLSPINYTQTSSWLVLSAIVGRLAE